MATAFKNKILTEIGSTETTVLEVDSGARATVVGFSITNLTEGVVIVSVYVTDDTDVKGHFVKNTAIPGNQSLRVVNNGEKLMLPGSNKISIKANQENAVDVVLSYVEIV